MNIKQKLVSANKYNIKCPYLMNATRIVVHNTANDASAENEVAYMIKNNNQVSFHYAVDDKEIVQGIPENRNAWHAGDVANGIGNRQGIAIEICYSKSGGDKFNKAERLAAEFIASKLKEKGWGIDKVTKHQDYSKKYCPHRTLDLGWQRFINIIKEYMTPTKTSTPKPNTYTTGNYKTLYNMKVRDGVWGKVKTVRQLTADGRKNATSKISGAQAIYKSGTVFTAKKIINHTDGSVWAQSPSGFICIKDKNQIYCKKC